MHFGYYIDIYIYSTVKELERSKNIKQNKKLQDEGRYAAFSDIIIIWV